MRSPLVIVPSTSENSARMGPRSSVSGRVIRWGGYITCDKTRSMAATAATADAMSPHRILIITTLSPPPNYEVEAILGPCWGITVRSRSVVGQACAGCQTFAGGEITALTKLATDS